MDGWRGKCSNLITLLELDFDLAVGKLLGSLYIDQYNLEDGRLFMNKYGKVYVYVVLLLGAGLQRATVNTIISLHIFCDTDSHCTLSVGLPRPLLYAPASATDKNWVPWNGTSTFTYSKHKTFGPHTILVPDPKLFTIMSYQTSQDLFFFREFNLRFKNKIHLSGGSASVLEGDFFVSVGHAKIHPGCLHQEAAGTHSVESSCAHIGANVTKLDVAFQYG